jgi:hypothetical protein
MQFKDLVQYNVTTERGAPVAIVSPAEIHEIANEAAKNFLNLLIR